MQANEDKETVPKKMRLREIALAARVSVATVSRVAHGLGGVSPHLREKVLNTARLLGVELEERNRFRVIAFLLSNRQVLHPFHSSVLVGAEAYCAEHEYALLFLTLNYSPSVPWKNLVIPPILQSPELIRAAILAGTNSQNLLELLAHKGVPSVVLGNNVLGEWRKEAYSAVYFDDIGGAREMTNYLLSSGHRRIVFLGNSRLPWFARRYEGYCRAMTEASLEPVARDVDSQNGEDIGYLSTKMIFSDGQTPTALFAGEDAVARGAYKAIRDRGLRIPEDISVVGFNDTAEASALSPALTTVRVFTEQLGRQMAELVVERVASSVSSPRAITLPTQLVKRESCMPLRPMGNSRRLAS